MSAPTITGWPLRLDDSPPIDMPPVNIVKCQCSESCPLSGSCELEATGDDLLCDHCRKAKEAMEKYRARLFSPITASLAMISARRSALHCHRCDPEFDTDGVDDAASDR